MGLSPSQTFRLFRFHGDEPRWSWQTSVLLCASVGEEVDTGNGLAACLRVTVLCAATGIPLTLQCVTLSTFSSDQVYWTLVWC